MAKNKKEVSFEDGLKKLESLVETLEEGDIPLADLVEKFEEGTKLLKNCENQLKEAELKIEKLSASGDRTELFDPESES